MKEWSQKEIEQALAVLERKKRQESFDPRLIGSKPTSAQESFIRAIGEREARYRIIRAGNRAGKTATCAWELARVITETHPWWTRPEKWGTGPLTAIVAGQDRKMMELEIWQNKLLPHMTESEWKVSRVSGLINYVTHIPTGNRIVFLPHSDSSDKARRHMQGYTGQYLWIDEMPINSKIWEELEKRIMTDDGMLVASFTSKARSPVARRIVDNHCEQSYCTLYRFAMLDNPALADRADEILAQLSAYPKSYRNAVLYGDWYEGDSGVYSWNEDMLINLPEHYSPAWRHVEAVDPAISSKMGYVLAAEDPGTGKWYIIKAKYFENLTTSRTWVEAAAKESHGYHVVARVSDVAPWYTQEAASMGIHYTNPWKKTERKDSLIQGLQTALSGGRLLVSTSCTDFVEEVVGCQWSETAPGRIVNSQSYHLLDAAMYAVDSLPKWKGPTVQSGDYHINLRMECNAYREKKAQIAAKKQQKMQINRTRRARHRRKNGRNTLPMRISP